ncbi:MAG TPA: pyridoxamine 5'-phosphate oxidase family protein [Acidimicrobiales bacterium]|nr:pyridoxamine 5'-phosphate oxidase family protein [Acidimicrobiales bacterium]
MVIGSAHDDAQFSAVELGRAQCLELLRGVQVGRVVLSLDCLPVALPVNISVLDEDVVFRTDRGSKLDAAMEGQVVSIEADEVDALYRTGWSVLVTGVAELVTDPRQVESANSHLLPWAPGPHEFVVRVPSTRTSGRELVWGRPSGQ